MTAIRTRVLPVAIGLAVGLAACSSDSTSSTDTADTADTAVVDNDGGGYYNPPTPAPETSATDAPDTSVDDSGDKAILRREGDLLVDGDGFTLYIFTADPPDTSTCNVGCIEAWPAFLAGPGGYELQGDLDPTDYAVLTRDDGTTQVSYQGQPLYYYAGDSAPGDVNGDGVGGVWFAVEFA